MSRPILHGDPVERGHPLNRGLVALCMPLPGRGSGRTLWDLAGRNHGTLTNGPTWVAGPNGFGAVSLTGASSQYVSLGTSTAINPTVMTVAVLVRRTAALSGATFTHVGRLNSAFPSGRYYGLLEDASGPYFQLNTSGGIVNPQSTGATTPLNTWCLLAGTYDGTTARLLRDGVEYASAAVSGTVNQSAVDTRIGAFSDGSAGLYATGDYGGCWIYSRALATSEVGRLYEQVTRGHPDTLRRVPTSRSFVGAGSPSGGLFLPAFANW